MYVRFSGAHELDAHRRETAGKSEGEIEREQKSHAVAVASDDVVRTDKWEMCRK